MYVPNAFRIDDPDLIHEIVRANPFATLVSSANAEPIATHLPMILTDGVLFGHVAKANPHWNHFATPSLAIFAGPHGYVSPSWYETRPSVPTWNYVSVHAYGVPEIVTSAEESVAHLKLLVQTFDPALHETHPESTEEERLLKMLPGIVAFRMPVTRWEAKAKLNQNKPDRDREAVRARYLESEDPQEQAMARLMS